MSERYPGGFITKNYVAPTPTSAPGIWTLDQQEQAQQAGIWPFGGPFNYIEDVFSTYLYTGNGSTQNIVNGIDLAGKGGMVWGKDRSSAGQNFVYDTARGATNALFTNLTNAQNTGYGDVTSFNSNGFSLNAAGGLNLPGDATVSWTFRKQPKFFDVVTYTGTGSARTIAHNLGSTPGCIIVKCTSSAYGWPVYHRSLGASKYLYLDGTGAAYTDSTPGMWNQTAPTSTVFSVGTDTYTNQSGQTYVAYLFADNAGGFGLTGTDNVISCGSYTGTSATGLNVTLGYEPQWVLIKRAGGSGSAGSWYIFDVMRGMSYTDGEYLSPNTSTAEASFLAISPTSTGFVLQTTSPAFNYSGDSYIYIAIRRGPMKVPTDATKVFNPYVTSSVSNVGSTGGTLYNTGFVTDTILQKNKAGTDGWYMGSRFQGTNYMKTETTAAETSSSALFWDSNVAAIVFSNPNYGTYAFKRAPSFFDEVCYTGDGTNNKAITHNLTVSPEFAIIKSRSNASDWWVYHSGLPNANTSYLWLETNDFVSSISPSTWSMTTTTFNGSNYISTNKSGYTYVAYLFATCAGVSKVGNYTGTGATQTINCGFTGGARFVLVKRTDSTGDWYVWDTARGMVSGTDPSLLLNSTAAEVNANSIYTTTGGFQIVSTAAGINASGGSYIYFSVA